MSADPIAVELVDGVATLVLDVPGESVNTLSTEVGAALERTLDALEHDGAVKALVIASGKADGFVAGAKLEMIQAVRSAAEATALSEAAQAGFDRLERFGKPVVAAIHGACLGGGLELAMACHYRVAADLPRTALGLPEVMVGLLPGGGGTQRLPRLVGRGRALEILLSGEMVAADEALRIGLVNRVVAKDALMNEAIGLMKKMIGNAPLSLQYTIDSVNAGLDMSFEDAQDHEATLFGVLGSTGDKTEGTSAFLEKRPAKFQGR